jgi:2-succinyl-5-enolpyruvyl-6-hydroxy-3-cyclohexene-1-carboxylate synthase
MIRPGDHLNLGWARLILEELWRLGVRDLCIAPGSRSAPLTLAAADHPHLRSHCHFDERGLGFLALGLAKSSDRPVALITTSGTAVANLYPAVIEARLSRVPLIILSADRPAELIDCGANQAIAQPGLFAGYPVFAQNLPTPDRRIDPRFVLGTLDQLWQTLQHNPGPAHLNCPYAEPLYPGQGEALPDAYLDGLRHWLNHDQPLTRYQAAPTCDVTNEETWRDFSRRRGLIVAAQIPDPAAAAAVQALARQLGWPLLADVQSQLRFVPEAITHVDLALHHPLFQHQLAQAEVLLQVGGRLISKRLSQFISQHAWQARWQLDESAERLAPDYGLDRRLVAPIAPWCQQQLNRTPAAPRWERLDGLSAPLAPLLDQQLGHWSELGLAHRLCALVTGPLVLGNSLPARLLDMLGQARPQQAQPGRIFSNRGASGIDGLIATASGIALGMAQENPEPAPPTTLLIGDTSALHDLNSLALLRRPGLNLVLVLVNNDGGSIFTLLPGAAQSPALEGFFRLPHGLDFAHAAAQFGLPYQAPTSLDEFARSYQLACQGGVTLIECRFPAEEAARQLAELAAACRTLDLPDAAGQP